MDNKDNDENSSSSFEQISPEDLDKKSETEPEEQKKQEAPVSQQGADSSGERNFEIYKQKSIIFLQKINETFQAWLNLEGIPLPDAWKEKLPENPRLLTIPITIFISGLFVVFILALFAPTATKREASKTLPLVRVIEAKAEQIKLPLYSQGIVEPKTEIQIVSQVNGTVLEKSENLVNGGTVQEGELLLKVSDRSYQQDKARAEASLARAKSAQVAKQSELRVQGTLRSKSGKAQLREVNASVTAAEADLERVNDLIASTEIRAPFTGVIRRSNIKTGQLISAGSPVASLFSTDAATVEVALSDRQLSLIDREALSKRENLPKAKISGEFGNRVYTWSGKMVRLAGGRNEVNRLQYASVEIDNPYGADEAQPGRPDLSPGFFVEVQIDGRTFDSLVQLPRKVLKTNNRIWGVDENNLLKVYEAEILHRDKDTIFVTGGIKDGDLIVASEVEVFVQGLEVNPSILGVETSQSESPVENNKQKETDAEKNKLPDDDKAVQEKKDTPRDVSPDKEVEAEE